MKPKSAMPDRPFSAMTDKLLAQLLLKMESVLEEEINADKIDFDVLLKRNNLIEEIIFRYSNQNQ